MKSPHTVSIDLKKACERVPRKAIWSALGWNGLYKCYVKIIEDMHVGVLISIMSCCDTTNRLSVTKVYVIVNNVVLIDEKRTRLDVRLDLRRKTLRIRA